MKVSEGVMGEGGGEAIHGHGDVCTNHGAGGGITREIISSGSGSGITKQEGYLD